MQQPEWLDRNHMRVPSPALHKGVQGDGMRVIDPSDPIFEQWEAWMENKGMERPKS